MDVRTRALRTLDLDSGATPETIKMAFLDMVKVWHPDRFHDDPRLCLKAEEKLKEINEAYEVLKVVPQKGMSQAPPMRSPQPPKPETPSPTPSAPKEEKPPKPQNPRYFPFSEAE